MDFQKFGIDPRLSAAAENLRSGAFFHEKMLAAVIEKKENVCARISLDEGREEVCLLPALQWLVSQDAVSAAAKVLVVVPDGSVAELFAASARILGAGIGLGLCIVRDAGEGEGFLLDGDPAAASLLIGTPSSLLAASVVGQVQLRDYGFVVADSAERLAELPTETIRRFGGLLRPSWERRALLSCAKLTVKAKNLAWDLADNPSEIHIEGEVAKAQSVVRETWQLSSEDKLKFLLGYLSRENPNRLCVFCNLKDTAADLSKRLEVNGIASDFILGSLALDRKLALLERAKAGGIRALVLTDQGAEGLVPRNFPIVVNYDIPLEPEYFVKRIEMLDRAAPGAKVLSLACERYIYGLTAVEQYIDAKLDAASADPSLLTAEDKSAGMVFERRGRFDRPYRDERREGSPRNGSGDQGPREGRPSREGQSRDSRGRDGFPREDKSPGIRRSIADATGGSLDMSDTHSEVSLPPPPRPRDPGRGRDGRRGAARPEGGPAPRRDQAGKREAHGGGRREEARRPPESAPSGAGNPYDLPMEERMRRYREKYGRKLGDERSDETRGASQGRARAPRREGPPRADPAMKGQRPIPRAEAGRASDPLSAQARGSASPRDVHGREENPIAPARAAAPRQTGSEGVINRFLGLFKRKSKS